MWTFLVAGIVYLFGIAIVLLIRPSYMFTPDGVWKEFGIEKGDEYTLCPFWLFCIVWAILAYTLVALLEGVGKNPQRNSYENGEELLNHPSGPVELPKGYYVLNNKASRLAGVPKYVYLGQENPNE
jgi:lysylphosphatidylglycerol synthetase-like protein (DUF2156 family)